MMSKFLLLTLLISVSAVEVSAQSKPIVPNANEEAAATKVSLEDRRLGLSYYLLAFADAYNAAKGGWQDAKNASKSADLLQSVRARYEFLSRKRFEADLLKLLEEQGCLPSSQRAIGETALFTNLQHSGFSDGWQTGLTDARAISDTDLESEESIRHIHLMKHNEAIEFATYKCAEKIGLDARMAKKVSDGFRLNYEQVFPSR